ncbi:amino acid permease [Candidatus Woesearchaeota archaeon]|nr:amino acid permease [Candidatus Woesearchaeota archaeon]
MDRDYWGSIATLMGTIVGAGVLGIPFVVAKSGIFNGLVVILIIGILMTFVFLYLGEITLRTKGIHQLTGYAEIYLGKKGKFFMMLSMILGIYGALLAYIIGTGKAASALLGGNSFIYSLIIFAICSYVVYKGLKAVENSELYFVFGTIIVILLISMISMNKVNPENLKSSLELSKIFIPFGVILFAFLGTSGIPEIREELQGKEKSMKKVIIWTLVIVTIVYSLFALIAVGVMGKETTDIATVGLGKTVNESVLILGNLFAMLAMSTSFLVLGLALKEMYNYDYKISENKSWFLTCSIPLLMFLFLGSSTTFTKILSITGIIVGGLEGILIVLMYFKAKQLGNRKPEFEIKKSYTIAFLIILIFALGVIFGLR